MSNIHLSKMTGKLDGLHAISTNTVTNKFCQKMNSSNKNIEQIISNYKPPIFWKDKEIVKNQASKWSQNDAEKLIYKINDVELMIKKNYYNSLNIVSDFILNTAK